MQQLITTDQVGHSLFTILQPILGVSLAADYGTLQGNVLSIIGRVMLRKTGMTMTPGSHSGDKILIRQVGGASRI